MQLINNIMLQDIEKSLGLNLLDKKERDETMKNIVKIISNRAGVRIMEKFSEEEAEEFNKIPEENVEEMENYIISKNPKAKEIFAEEAKRVKEEILNIKIEE